MTPKPRILVVDDDALVAALVVQILRDYETTVAATGEEALELVRAHHFDVAICDLMLPGIGGMEVIREIRHAQPASKLMVLSACGTPANLLAALHQDVVDFIVKPFSPEELLTAVKNLVECELAIEIISATPHWIELKIPASFQVAASLASFFTHLQADMDEETRNAVSCAFRELVNNAIEHGAKGDRRQKIHVSYVRLKRAIVYRIEDPGPGFNMDSLSHAAVSYPGDPLRHAAVRQEKGMRAGGFGLLWVQNLADEVIYDERCNKVMFVKYLD